jgi:hypothetical protein
MNFSIAYSWGSPWTTASCATGFARSLSAPMRDRLISFYCCWKELIALLTYLLHGAESFLRSQPVNSWVILNICFYGEGLLAPCPTPKLEDHPSSAVRGCLFNLFTATLHIGGRSSIRNPRTRHAVVTGTHICSSFTGANCCAGLQENKVTLYWYRLYIRNNATNILDPGWQVQVMF